ncbi:MAG: ATP synthase F0 subunit B [Proteobacteria bacterium]|nr:ATP synthase F0 subunit B [Pseudomonadota bacterium]
MIHFDEKFWLAIAFSFFAALVAKYVWPIISKHLDSSSKKIAEEILAAKQMKESAEKLLTAAEKLYQEANIFSQKLIKDTEDEVRKLAADSQAALEEEIAKRKAAAIERIKSEEGLAIRELKIKIVNSALRKMQNELNLNQENHEKLIEKNLNNFGKTVH